MYFGFYVYVDSGIRVGRWRDRCSGLSLDEHEWEAGAGCGKEESLEPRVGILHGRSAGHSREETVMACEGSEWRWGRDPADLSRPPIPRVKQKQSSHL